MKPQAKTALLSFLVECAEHASINPPEKLESGISWSQSDGRVFHLPEPWAQQFSEKANSLARRRPWSERFTERYIRNSFSLVMLRAYDNGKGAASELLDNMTDMLDRYSVERRVYVPITGVVLAIPELRLGRVVLKYFDDDLFGVFASRIDSFLNENVTEEQVSHFKQLAREQLHGKVCAEFWAIAEPDRAIERAREETRRAVELLTFANASLFPAGHPQSSTIVGLDGEVLREGPWMLSLSDGEINTSHSAAMSAMPITIDEMFLHGLLRAGVIVLSETLSREIDQLSQWEKDLLRAVHWFAASQTQVELEIRLLNLITAMEALVTGPRERTQIKSKVSRRAALLTLSNDEERMQVESFIRNMYRARSDLAHGKNTLVLESDVSRLRNIAAQLITILVHRKHDLSSKKELFELLEQKRLGA